MSYPAICTCSYEWRVGMRPPCPIHGVDFVRSVADMAEEDDRRAEEALKAFIRGDFD